MTRARAIELLKGFQFCCDFDDCTNAWDCDECVEAWEMAIEALQQEPNEDLISRKDAIDEMGYCQTFLFDTRDKDEKISLEDALYALEQLPSAQPKRKTDGDTISRQDVVTEIHKYFVEEIDKTPTGIDEDGDEVYTDMPTVDSLLACNKELSKRIKALSSAEPKRGKWIAIDDTHSQCMECGAIFCITSSDEWEVNYCPNCGARMESDEQ